MAKMRDELRGALCRTVGPPILQITDGRGNLLENACDRLSALMFFPDDDAARERYIASPEQFRDDARLVPGRQAYANKPNYQIRLTADLFLCVLNAAPQKMIGIKCAMGLVGKSYARAKDAVGHPVAATERPLKLAWRSHMPIAHLCAAFTLWAFWIKQPQLPPFFELMDQENPGPPNPAMFDPRNLETLRNFLGAADWLRRAGETHFPAIGRGAMAPGRRPLLDPAHTFRAPIDLALPLVRVRRRRMTKPDGLSVHPKA
jgi:hypothetical protein